MAQRRPDSRDEFEQIPLRMHPRVFAALGADLVTNDVVAVIELVKNAYDAFARNVWLRFRNDPVRGAYLEIQDDGTGMTKDIIQNVWCVVATPFKELNPVVKSGHKERRVAGEKGLGRLSVARLGQHLYMLTKAPKNPCWEVGIGWSDIAQGDDLSESFATCRKYPGTPPFESGTLLRIYGLARQWDEDHISDLEENLGRLISPFSDLGDFNISLYGYNDAQTEGVEIESPDFLSRPKYSMRGSVDFDGNVEGTYRFSPFKEPASRCKSLNLPWSRIYEAIQDSTRYPYSSENAHCGPFSFELRAWDIAPEDTQEIAERFELQKSQVRRAIRAHKGISVYRDSVLVLPKSESARDWLGLDLRRISRVGTRLSTSQIVGYVSITAEDNPKIKDTSDRERLASCREVAEFEEILKAIVAILENERDEDRVMPDREKPMDDLFEILSAEDLVEEVIAQSDGGVATTETVSILRSFSDRLDSARKTIQDRFVYYSRLATVGTIANMLVHEIRGRTTAFGSFLDLVKDRFGPFKDKEVEEEIRTAENAVGALERLADNFAPLASRSFRRRRRHSILEDQIKECLALQRGEIERRNVQCYVPDTETVVAIDPGELDTIILNLVTNAVYWMGDVPRDNRRLEFRINTINNGERVRVSVHDSKNGPGVSLEDIEKVFWPGVTRKPGGIGMGLTVASELVAAYGGRLSTQHHGPTGGASFAFDLPFRKQL